MPISKSWGCNKCESQFETKLELIEHMKEHTMGKPEVKKAPVQPKPKPIPIQLTYLFKGQCLDCLGPVSTIELDINKKHFCIAMCQRCNKQLETKEVEKL